MKLIWLLSFINIILLIVNISVADDAFYKILHERMLIFNSFLLLLRRLKVKNGLYSVIYVLYNSK